MAIIPDSNSIYSDNDSLSPKICLNIVINNSTDEATPLLFIRSMQHSSDLHIYDRQSDNSHKNCEDIRRRRSKCNKLM